MNPVLAISVALVALALSGCTTSLGDAEECYPIITVPGQESEDLPDGVRLTNLTYPADWTFRASADCGPTYWRLERGDGALAWESGLEVDFNPHEVAFYNFSLVLKERDAYVVKHPVFLHVAEDHTMSNRHAFGAGTDNIHVEVSVGCCAEHLYANTVFAPSPGLSTGEWLRVEDAAGNTIGTGFDLIRMDGDSHPGWTDDIVYGTWTFTVVRDDPRSPYFNKELELATGISPAFGELYEPGDEVSPPPNPLTT